MYAIVAFNYVKIFDIYSKAYMFVGLDWKSGSGPNAFPMFAQEI